MSKLSHDLEDYLALRRSLGYKLVRAGQILADFVEYSDAAGADHVESALAVSWALGTSNPDSSWRADRLGAVRSFARYLHAIDPAHEVPAVGVIPRGAGRPLPYIYSKEEVTALMSAARRLRSPIQAATLETVIGLMGATGIRVGEVLRLDNEDLVVQDAVLRVRESKGGRSRLVPLDDSVADALSAYVGVRKQWFPEPSGGALFVSTVGRRLLSSSLSAAFVSVVGLAGLPARKAAVGPRLGDFRHTFAVRTVIGWHEAGLDTTARLAVLSAYMGHVNPSSTYWYLSASPELLGAAAGRLAPGMGGGR